MFKYILLGAGIREPETISREMEDVILGGCLGLTGIQLQTKILIKTDMVLYYKHISAGFAHLCREVPKAAN